MIKVELHSKDGVYSSLYAWQSYSMEMLFLVIPKYHSTLSNKQIILLTNLFIEYAYTMRVLIRVAHIEKAKLHDMTPFIRRALEDIKKHNGLSSILNHLLGLHNTEVHPLWAKAKETASTPLSLDMLNDQLIYSTEDFVKQYQKLINSLGEQDA